MPALDNTVSQRFRYERPGALTVRTLTNAVWRFLLGRRVSLHL